MPFTNPFYYILCLVFSPVWYFDDSGGFGNIIAGWIGMAMIWFAVASFGPKVIKFFDDTEKEAIYNKRKEREEQKGEEILGKKINMNHSRQNNFAKRC